MTKRHATDHCQEELIVNLVTDIATTLATKWIDFKVFHGPKDFQYIYIQYIYTYGLLPVHRHLKDTLQQLLTASSHYWQHQVITSNNVGLLSMEFCCIHLTTIFQEAVKISIQKSTLWKLQPPLLGDNELKPSNVLVFEFNTLRPRQDGRLFPDDIFKSIFVNENVQILIKTSLMFVPKAPINNIPSLVQIVAWRRPGDKPLSEPMMVNLLTHICVSRPQWVNAVRGGGWTNWHT